MPYARPLAWMRTLAVAVPLLLAALLALPAPAQEQIKGQPGLVVILDASGSMQNTSSYRQSRMEVAHQALRDYLENQRQHFDRLGLDSPVSVLVFGHRISFEDARQATGLPPGTRSNDPGFDHTAPYCNDIETVAPFQQLTHQSIDALTREVVGLSSRPVGMTPMIQAFQKAAAMLDPKYGGKIVFISDWAQANCVPPGLTFCDAINKQLSEIDRQGGVIELRYIWVPRLDDQENLLGCRPGDAIGIPPNDDREEPLEKLVDQSPVTFSAAFSRPPINSTLPGELTRNSKLVIKGPKVDGTTGTVHDGAFGTVDLFAGPHTFTGELQGKSFSGSLDVKSGTPQQHLVELDPADLIIEIRSSAGPIAGSNFAYTVRDDDGTVVTQNGSLGSGTDAFVLVPGTYRIDASLDDATWSRTTKIDFGGLKTEAFMINTLSVEARNFSDTLLSGNSLTFSVFEGTSANALFQSGAVTEGKAEKFLKDGIYRVVAELDGLRPIEKPVVLSGADQTLIFQFDANPLLDSDEGQAPIEGPDDDQREARSPEPEEPSDNGQLPNGGDVPSEDPEQSPEKPREEEDFALKTPPAPEFPDMPDNSVPPGNDGSGTTPAPPENEREDDSEEGGDDTAPPPSTQPPERGDGNDSDTGEDTEENDGSDGSGTVPPAPQPVIVKLVYQTEEPRLVINRADADPLTIEFSNQGQPFKRVASAPLPALQFLPGPNTIRIHENGVSILNHFDVPEDAEDPELRFRIMPGQLQLVSDRVQAYEIIPVINNEARLEASLTVPGPRFHTSMTSGRYFIREVGGALSGARPVDIRPTELEILRY